MIWITMDDKTTLCYMYLESNGIIAIAQGSM